MLNLITYMGGAQVLEGDVAREHTHGIRHWTELGRNFYRIISK